MKNLQELNGQPAEPLMIIGPMLNLKEVVRYRDETYTYLSSKGGRFKNRRFPIEIMNRVNI